MKPISFLFLIVVAVAYTSTIHVNLEREILKTGFHRTFPKKNCELNVLQEISPTWYISDDEYENLRRFSTDLPEIHYLNGKNDIEKPSWKSETNDLFLVRVGTNLALISGILLITFVILTKEKKKTE
eukprot:gene11003-3709_t